MTNDFTTCMYAVLAHCWPQRYHIGLFYDGKYKPILARDSIYMYAECAMGLCYRPSVCPNIRMSRIFPKNGMFWLSGGEKIMTLALFVLIRYRRVTERQTSGRTDMSLWQRPRYAQRRAGKNISEVRRCVKFEDCVAALWRIVFPSCDLDCLEMFIKFIFIHQNDAINFIDSPITRLRSGVTHRRRSSVNFRGGQDIFARKICMNKTYFRL